VDTVPLREVDEWLGRFRRFWDSDTVTRTVVVRRAFPAPIEDVWDACTTAERISRWFMPVTGDLRLGGKYQLEGNAGGEMLNCEPPRLLRVTWVMGEGPASEVEMRLSRATARKPCSSSRTPRSSTRRSGPSTGHLPPLP
jgi:uncharacterized protein YndB with AHSA1/START domain